MLAIFTSKTNANISFLFLVPAFTIMFLCSQILAVICIAHVNQAYNTLGTRELSLIMIMPVLQNVQCKRNMEKKTNQLNQKGH